MSRAVFSGQAVRNTTSDSLYRRQMRAIVVILCGFAAAVASVVPAFAQNVPGQTVAIPGLWDPGRRNDRPDMTRVGAIRFATEEDFAPFHYRNGGGALAGFDVDLARAICDELKVPCSIQMRRFDKLLDALDQNQSDAVLGAHQLTTELRQRFEVSDRYFVVPARFVVRRSASSPGDVAALRGRTIGVVANTSHAAFLTAFFRTSDVRTFADEPTLREALISGQVDAAFGNALALSDLVHGPEGTACCRFLGGPYTESRFFGEGMAIVMKKGNQPLRAAVNYALQRLWDRGVYREIYLKHFPVSLF